MKKFLLWGAAAALVLSLSSCDDDTITEFVQAGLLGTGEITISGQDGFYTNDTTIEFASSIMDELDTLITINDVDRPYVGTLDLFANVDLQNGKIVYPFMAFQFSDSTTGSYTITGDILNTQRLRNFNFDSLANLIFRPCGLNVMIIAISDTAWYVAYGGNINITEYPTLGNDMRGTFNNIQAYYFTKTDVDNIQEHLDDPDFELSDYFTKTAVINSVSGTSFKSKRYPVMIKKIIEAAENEDGSWTIE